MSLKKVTQPLELEELLDHNKELFLMKNSLTCPISHAAFEAYKRFADNLEETVYYLNVQESRTLSQAVADTYSVKHESPQVLHFRDGEVVWHRSHGDITEHALMEQLKSEPPA